ncbi:hypothetical protein Trco_003221 [Trichoderma cornu-damae]|uniref:Uncharacterized protein n=1 Tax=Trichoderma cornu-damae TaxID=654480 RepID=A0A9P8QP95_9HYPO|nr:hypothetical protein Trco_003221 [Trichoderma cornu-damae]
MEYVLPKPDYIGYGEWHWPFNKFYLDPEDLFTTLHDRYNTQKLPLQDPVAFHQDVCECANSSATLDEFYSLLEERKAERIKEMTRGWNNISRLITASPRLLACDLCYDFETHTVKTKPGTKNDSMAQRWWAFIQFSRHMSFDALVVFFDGFVRDQRKKWEELDRWATENLAEPKNEKMADRLAAEAARNEPQSPRDTPTPNAGAASIAPSDEPQATSPQQGGRKAQTATPQQTAESSMERKRKSGEDENGSGRKKRRLMSQSAGDDEAERLTAGQVQSKAVEAAEHVSTSKQAEKRKRTDDSQDEARNKRAKTVDDPITSCTQSPIYSPNPDGFGSDASPTELNTESIPSTAVPSDDEPDTIDKDKEWTRRSPQVRASSNPPGCSETINATQASPNEDMEGPAAKDTTTETANVGTSRGKARASRRQRVDKRRAGGEHGSPPPQKQPRQKKRQERKASPSIERLMRSRRSSRRNPGQELWCLGDDATACAAVGARKP